MTVWIYGNNSMTTESDIIFDILHLDDSSKKSLDGFDSRRDNQLLPIYGDIILAGKHGENLVGNDDIVFFINNFRDALTGIANGKDCIHFDLLEEAGPMEIRVENDLIAISRLFNDFNLQPWRKIEPLSFSQVNQAFKEFRNKARRLVSEYVDPKKLDVYYGYKVL